MTKELNTASRYGKCGSNFKKIKLVREPKIMKCSRYIAKEISPKNKRYLEENIFCILFESSNTAITKNAPSIWHVSDVLSRKGFSKKA